MDRAIVNLILSRAAGKRRPPVAGHPDLGGVEDGFYSDVGASPGVVLGRVAVWGRLSGMRGSSSGNLKIGSIDPGIAPAGLLLVFRHDCDTRHYHAARDRLYFRSA